MISIMDTEMIKIKQSPSASKVDSSERDGIRATDSAADSQQPRFDKEAIDKLGMRSNSVVEYAEPLSMLDETNPEYVVVREEIESDYEEQFQHSKKEETSRHNIATIKRSSLASSLGQHGDAAIEDMRSIFKTSKKSTKPPSRLPSIQD